MSARLRGKLPIWLHEHPADFLRDPVPDRVDAVVIGAGVAGAACALHLARSGIRTAVLEKGRVATRASGRNDGQVLLGLGEHLNRLVEQFGKGRALELWDFIEGNHRLVEETITTEQLPCSWIQDGGCRIADTQSEKTELEESAKLMREHGIAHEWLSAEALASRLPIWRDPLGALFLPEEAIFDPHAFTTGILALARRKGASLLEGCEVTSVLGEPFEFEIRSEQGDLLKSSIVIHASSALAPQLDRSGFLEAQVFPFRGQILATEELADDVLSQIPNWAMSTNFCYEYFRRHGSRLTLGGLRWSVPGEETGTRDDATVHPGIAKGLRTWLGDRMPALREAKIEKDWTGIMAGTKDGLPLIGEIPGRAGEYACCAFNGYGMSFAFRAGQCLAEMLENGRASHPAASLFAPRRFRDG